MPDHRPVVLIATPAYAHRVHVRYVESLLGTEAVRLASLEPDDVVVLPAPGVPAATR